MKKIRLLTLLVLGLLVGTAYAQNRVSGVVKSSEDGQPLAGVTVRVKGTNLGAVTGSDGSYTISNAPAGATLEFNYAGMRKQDLPLAGKSTLNVTLAPDALQAEAVTVTALGGVKQSKKLGYATTTVKGDDLARTNAISPINALQGKVAGLQISTSGSAGLTSAPVVVLRGAKSLNKNNSPIYVIDGIVMENPTVLGNNASMNGTSGDTRYGNQLKNLNMNDYESVTVLKGAAATSIYGSRGANGAIVLTSKSGKARKGIGVDVNYSHEFQQTYENALKLQNIYGMGDPTNGFEGAVYPGKPYNSESMDNFSWGPRMEGQMLQQYYKLWPDNYNPSDPFLPQPENWKAIFQTGQVDNVGVALTGGSEKATFRLSYGYTKMKGSLPNNEFNRHSIDFTTNGVINDVFSVDFSMKYGNSNTLNAGNVGSQGGTNFVMKTAYYLPRNVDLDWYRDNYINKETWERMPTDQNGVMSEIQGVFNQAYDNNEVRNEQTIIARAQLNAKLTSWLDASASMSYNLHVINSETKNYGSGIGRSGGSYGVSGSQGSSYNALATLHSNNSFVDDNLTLDIRLMYELYGNAAGGSYWRNTKGGLLVPGLFTFANSKEAVTVGEIGADRSRRNSMTMGVAGVVNLGWKDQIFLELTARNDWNSSLTYPNWVVGAANNYSVFYPSVNASWVFSDTFNIDSKVLSMGRLRASFAQVGSGTGAYNTASGAGGYNVSVGTSPSGETIFSANPNNTTLPNYDLKPEIQQTMEFGADLRFLNGKIGVDVTYYKSNTFNQIMSVSSVSESGVNSRMINAGNIQNQGWEVQLDFRPIQTNKVTWEIGLNWSRNRGKIVELHKDIKNYAFNSVDYGAIPGIYGFEGGAFGQIIAGPGYGYSYGGAFAIYNDKNNPNNPNNGMRRIAIEGNNLNEIGNGYKFKYTSSGQSNNYYNTENPYTVLGQVEPDFIGGINTRLQYAGFDLFVQLDGRVGGSVVSPDVRYAMQSGNLAETLYGRDAEHGGLPRVNYKGDVVNDGVMLEGVFDNNNGQFNNKVISMSTKKEIDLSGMTFKQAVDAGHIQPMMAAYYYRSNFGFNAPMNGIVQDLTYLSLREVSLGYNFPEKWIKHIGMQSARLSFTARNICYLYNDMNGGANPESLSSNNPLTPVNYGGVPYVRNFNLAVNLRF